MALPQLGPRMRKVVKGLAFVLLFIVTFVFAVQMTFPFDRVKQKIVDTLSEKYDVSIGDVERGFMPGKVVFKTVNLKTRPTQADLDRVNKIDDEKERDTQRALLPTTIFIERLEVDVSLLGALGGNADVDIDAKIGPGHISGNIVIGKARTKVDLEGTNLPGSSLPLRDAFSGLPLGGKVQFAVALDVPNGKSKATGKVGPDWSKSNGSISFACPSNCTLGDGVSKFHPKVKNSRQEATVKDGVSFGQVKVQSLTTRVVIAKGKAEVTKFEVVSKDLALQLEAKLDLSQEIGDSMVSGCFRYKPSDELNKREGGTYSAFMLIGGPLGPDGLFHVKLDGKAKELKKLALTCGPSAVDDEPVDSGKETKPSRPTLGAPVPDAAEAPKLVTPVVTPDAAPAPVPAPNGSGSGSGSAKEIKPPGPEHEENVPAGSGSDGHTEGDGSAAPPPSDQPVFQ